MLSNDRDLNSFSKRDNLMLGEIFFFFKTKVPMGSFGNNEPR